MQFVALLRGVNVGKGNRVPMAEFRQLLKELGCTDIKTLLNSGNAIFTSTGRSGTKHAAAIAGAIEERFGFTTPVIVKTAAEIETIIAESPIVPGDGEHSRFLVAFGATEAALTALQPLVALSQASERLVITSVAAYLSCPAGVLESAVGKAMLGKAGRGVTTRNWATVLKIQATFHDT